MNIRRHENSSRGNRINNPKRSREKFEVKFSRTWKILQFLMQIVYNLYRASFVILTNTNMALILSCSNPAIFSRGSPPVRNRHIVLLICGGIKHHSVRRTSPHFFPARLLHIESWIFISKVRWESSICKKWTADFVRVFPLPGSKFQPWLEPRINFDKIILLPLPLTNEYLSTLPRSMPDVILKWIRYKIKKIVINK